MSYSWGDDSGESKSIGSGYDYKSARKAYDSGTPMASRSVRSSGDMGSSLESKRSYKSRIGKTEAPVGKDVVTASTHPIVVCCDVTGSMSSWPSIIFEKLPLLGKEVEHYAPDYAISFTAFGDCYCDGYPLQVRDFDVGEALDAHISALYPEGGGGDTPESPDLVAYYYNNHCKMDKAIKPFFFIITDAPSHDELSFSAIKTYTGDKAQSDYLDSKAIFKELEKKFNVFVLLKNGESYSYWSKIFSEQKIKEVEEPRDIVELIIACIASEMGEIKDFEMRSSKRHADKPDRVSRVMKSVKIEEEVKPEDVGKASKTKTSTSKTASKKSEKLDSGKSMKSKKLV